MTKDSFENNLEVIEKSLKYSFKDRSLLTLAFIHRSFINENRETTSHNERLEFLGDSVLGLTIASYLYEKHPELSEGELSFLRSRLVEAGTCAQFLNKLDLARFIRMGRGEKMNDGRGRESIIADLFEALVGAVYLDGGLKAAQDFILNNFLSEINQIIATPIHNWKALLQDHCQRLYQVPPRYETVSESGPDHSKNFEVAVFIEDQKLGEGSGASKKEAQQSAAKDAVQKLKLV